MKVEEDLSTSHGTVSTARQPTANAAAALRSSDYLVAMPAFGVPAAVRLAALAQHGTVVAVSELRAVLSPRPWDDRVIGGRCGSLDGAVWPSSATRFELQNLTRKVRLAAIAEEYTFLHTNVANGATEWLQPLVSDGWLPVETLVTFAARPTSGQTDAACAPLLPSDAPAVLRIARDALVSGRIHRDPNIAPTAKRQFYKELSRSLMDRIAARELFGRVLKQGDDLVAFAIGRDGETYGGEQRIGLLWLIGVDPDRQTQGFGQRVLGDFISAAAQRMDVCEVSTSASNYAALALYRKAGFPIAGVVHQLHCHLEATGR